MESDIQTDRDSGVLCGQLWFTRKKRTKLPLESIARCEKLGDAYTEPQAPYLGARHWKLVLNRFPDLPERACYPEMESETTGHAASTWLECATLSTFNGSGHET